MQWRGFIKTGCVLALCLAQAAAGPVPFNTPDASAKPPAAPALKKLAPGVFELGKVRLDKNQKSLRFPAVLNMNKAIAEYLLVHKRGKTHESLLTTEVEPYHIHVA